MIESACTSKRSYDMAFKQKVIAFAEKSSNRGAARKFGVDEKRVREWRKTKESISSNPSKKKRLQGGGRKPLLNADLEGQPRRLIEEIRYALCHHNDAGSIYLMTGGLY